MLTIPLVREADATDERVRESFRDIKATLRVPLVSQLFQAWATVPRFLDSTWRRLRPNVLSPAFIEQARKLGVITEQAVNAWRISDHAAALRERNLGEGDVLHMREISSMFDTLDPKLLVIAHAVRLALGGSRIGGAGGAGPQRGEQSANDHRGLSVALVDERDAPLRVRTTLEDIKRTFGSSLVATEYRAMAAFPEWLDVWWKDCKPAMEAPRWAALVHDVDAAAIEAALALPYRVNLADEQLLRSDVTSEDRARLARIDEAFCESLPGLIISMSVAHSGLNPKS